MLARIGRNLVASRASVILYYTLGLIRLFVDYCGMKRSVSVREVFMMSLSAKKYFIILDLLLLLLNKIVINNCRCMMYDP